ncbi:hypothetical protein BMS3Bbin10_02907 [bacterium BMS3Bbin10]|nr:hypothetical protein BMS3Bbin10_02907 [bacterium BMS3Bbin10]HDL16902.1 hypothetical protein [Hyphomicrobiales bacterium]
MAAPPGRVEKIMSLDLKEFHRSLTALGPDMALGEGQQQIVISADGGEVRIAYEPLEKAALGGLLALPRAKVTLCFGELSEAERRAFLARFDRAFQRGGG